MHKLRAKINKWEEKPRKKKKKKKKESCSVKEGVRSEAQVLLQP